MPAVEVTPGLLAGINTSYRTGFRTGFEGRPTLYDKVSTVVESRSSREIYPFLGSVSGMREWIGNRVVEQFKAYDFEIRNRHFEKTFAVNRDEIEDDQYGFYGMEAQTLGDLAARHPDELVFALFKAGFTTRCYDGQFFFDTDHPAGVGGTASNMGTAALTSGTYDSARVQMAVLLDDVGEILNIEPNLLVVPPQLATTAAKILNFDMIVEGSVLQPNVFRNSATLLVAPRLGTDANNWYLLDTTKPVRPFILQIRKRPELVAKTDIESDAVFDQNVFVWGVDWRGAAGYALWQLAYGASVT